MYRPRGFCPSHLLTLWSLKVFLLFVKVLVIEKIILITPSLSPSLPWEKFWPLSVISLIFPPLEEGTSSHNCRLVQWSHPDMAQRNNTKLQATSLLPVTQNKIQDLQKTVAEEKNYLDSSLGQMLKQGTSNEQRVGNLGHQRVPPFQIKATSIDSVKETLSQSVNDNFFFPKIILLISTNQLQNNCASILTGK